MAKSGVGDVDGVVGGARGGRRELGIEDFIEIASHIQDAEDMAEVLVNASMGLGHVSDDAADPDLYGESRWGFCESGQ